MGTYRLANSITVFAFWSNEKHYEYKFETVSSFV